MNPFYLNGQSVWYHDEGEESGYFHTFDSLVVDPHYDAPRKVHVFLPRGYGESRRAYPVVYLNDGNTAFWADGLSPYSWNVAQTLSALYQKKAITPVIIVAVHPLNRSHEYLHVEEFSGFFKKEGGGLTDYTNYLVRLKHFIDDTYQTQKSRDTTSIVGSSHGGLAAFYTGCLQGEHFGKVAALSPSFWVGGVFNLRQTPLVQTLDKYLKPANYHRPQIWIDWGCQHFGGFHNMFIESQAAKWSGEMVSLLQQDYQYILGENLFKYEDLMGGHDEQAWAYRFGLILRQFYSLG